MKLIYLNNKYSISEFMATKIADPWAMDIQGFLREWDDDLDFIIVNTSGSTGKPKPIKLFKSSIKRSAKITNDYFNLSHLSTALLCLPIKYIAGKLMLVRALEADMDLIIVEPSLNPINNLNSKLDFIAMTPLQVESSLNNNSELFKLISTIIIGGGPVSVPLAKNLQLLSTACYQTYGMTETITHIALQRINGLNRTNDFQVLDGFEIGQDDRGCLTIKASHIYNKYVVTNDLVAIKSPSTFQWLGRYDNVINTGGVKVHPEKIESSIAELMEYPYFVIGVQDDVLGQRVTLCIESTTWDVAEQSELLNQINSRLDKFEVPRSILFFDCFNYTETGKIRRKATIEKY